MNMSESKGGSLIFAEPQYVDFIHVLNPFDVQQRVTHRLDWEPTKTVADYIDDPSENYAYSVNGKIVDFENIAEVRLTSGDNVVIFPIPTGGDGDSKSILRLVALVVISVYAPGMASGLMGGATSGFGYHLAVAGITMAGSLIVNSVLPPVMPDLSNVASDTLSGSPTYGVDGAKNTSDEGLASPVTYGTFRVGGNLINSHVVNDGDDQHLRLLLNLGEGEIDGVSDIRINDQPASNYQNIETDARLGASFAGRFSRWFYNTVIPINKGLRLTDEFWVQHDTTNIVDRIRVDVSFPAGLKSVDETSGASKAHSVSIKIDHKKVGDDTWQSETHDVRANTGAALRRSFWLKNLTEQGTYQVKVKRVAPESESQFVVDQVYVTDINEVIDDSVYYNYSAMLGLSIRLSDQLSGLPKVTCLVRGKKVKVWDSANDNWASPIKYSENPAWIAWDMITNTRYGGGLPESRLDLEKWIDWADHCNVNNLTFNGVFDSRGNLWDALKFVMKTGHAQVVQIGTRYSLAIERPEEPVMMFTASNIIEGTFSQNWLSSSDRANEIEITYFDAADNYKKHAIRVADAASVDKGESQRSASITAIGLVNQSDVEREAMLHLNLNRYIKQTISFEAAIESIACTVGDIIYIQHDMPQWGYSGRLRLGSTSTVLQLDRDVDMDADNYKMLVVFDQVELVNGVISDIFGNTIYIAGWDGVGRARRFVANGQDIEVVSRAFSGTYGYGVVLKSSTGLNLLDVCQVYDADVIEERNVVNPETGIPTSEITLTSAMTSAPAQFANFMFGKVGKIKKPFRVKAISGSQDYSRKIDCLEYNASVYDLSGNAVATNNYSDLDASLSHVTIDGSYEELVKIGSAIRSRVTVHWTSEDESYRAAEVWTSLNGAAFQNMGSQIDHFSIEAGDGDDVRFKIIAYDTVGSHLPASTAPIHTHNVEGKTAPPGDVQNFAASRVTGSVKLSWDAIDELDVIGYEIRMGDSWDNSQLVTTNFAGTSMLTENVLSGSNIYNIRAIDSSGNVSVTPASVLLSVSRPPSVANFAAVQNGSQIYLSWNEVKLTSLAEYEIREGLNWTAGQFVVKTSSTSHSIVTNETGNRTFWIKAIDDLSFYSDVATFTVVNSARSDDRNLVLSSDEFASGFPGVKWGTEVLANNLRLSSGEYYGEYTYSIDLGKPYRAKSIVNMNAIAIQDSELNWIQASFQWNSLDANAQWVTGADINAIDVFHEFAIETGLQAGEIDGLSLDGTLISINGITPIVSSGVAYQPGRFNDGVHVEDVTKVAWPFVFADTWKLSFWLKVVEVNDSVCMSLTGPNGNLRLRYQTSDDSFNLEDDSGNVVTVPFTSIVDDRILISVVQTTINRKLFVGKEGAVSQYSFAVENLAPITELGQYRLYNWH
jgi:predicted phage tail protein